MDTRARAYPHEHRLVAGLHAPHESLLERERVQYEPGVSHGTVTEHQYEEESVMAESAHKGSRALRIS
jgi:hypothetical protein